MNHGHNTHTPQPPHLGARGYGASALAPEVWSWLPPKTRISTLWIEDTPDGDRLVYCYIRDTVGTRIGIAASMIFFTGGIALEALLIQSEIIPLWLPMAVVLPLAAACSWASVWYPETGPGGTYPIDAEGRLLPKVNNPRLKVLNHRAP